MSACACSHACLPSPTPLPSLTHLIALTCPPPYIRPLACPHLPPPPSPHSGSLVGYPQTGPTATTATSFSSWVGEEQQQQQPGPAHPSHSRETLEGGSSGSSSRAVYASVAASAFGHGLLQQQQQQPAGAAALPLPSPPMAFGWRQCADNLLFDTDLSPTCTPPWERGGGDQDVSPPSPPLLFTNQLYERQGEYET